MISDYRAELCRMTEIVIKNTGNYNVMLLDFYIIGKGKIKYYLKMKNPSKDLINRVCNICSIFYFDVDLHFSAKESDCFTFFGIFDYNGEYTNLIAFSNSAVYHEKLCWTLINENEFCNLPIKSINDTLIANYNILQDLLIKQSYSYIDIDSLKNYLSAKIENFKRINKNNRFISFILEAFLNSRCICENLHSQLLTGDNENIIIRKQKINKNILSQAFQINEINGFYRLISEYNIFMI